MKTLVERVAVADGVWLHVERRDGARHDVGVPLHVERRDGGGEGAVGEVAFVLVHGLASNLRLWDGVAECLAGWGHDVAAVDQRGHGRSDKPDDGYDVTTVTDDLAQVVRALGFDQPVLVGQSWGANVVLEAAWRFPALVRGVACVDGGWIELRRRFPDWEACVSMLRPPATAGHPASEIEGWLRRDHPDWSDTAINGALACFEHRPDGAVAPWLSVDHHLAVLAGLWDHSPSSRYAEVEVPVLLVAAEPGQDGRRGSKAEVAEAAGALPRSRVRWMAGDHDLHAHHPEELATVLHAAIDDGFFS